MGTYYIVRVPDKIASFFKEHTKDMRVVCTFNQALEKQCAIMSSGQGFYFVMMTKDSRKKLGIDIGQPITVSIRKDDSKYGLQMPEELKEVFSQDQLSFQFFESLTKGKQRSLLHIAGNVKNQQKRIERSLAIAHHITKNKGKIDYKELQSDIREFRV